MAQPDIKQESLSLGDRMTPSCSQEIDLEEVTSFGFLLGVSCWEVDFDVMSFG